MKGKIPNSKIPKGGKAGEEEERVEERGGHTHN
jgi:hypothetical protein